MDNAKQFAYYPVAVLKGVRNFSNGTISVKFKTIAGDADRASGILFNVKPNGDWLAVRYNDTENNVALWEFHNGIRRNMRFSDRDQQVHARPRRVARAEDDGRRRRFQGLARRRRWRSSTRSAASRARAAAAPRPTRICSPRTTRCCVRRSPARSACGRRPTARAISKTTSSARSRSSMLKKVLLTDKRARDPPPRLRSRSRPTRARSSSSSSIRPAESSRTRRSSSRTRRRAPSARRCRTRKARRRCRRCR